MTMRRRGLSTVQFGVTDLCNYRCIMCPQTADQGLYGAPERRGARLHDGRRGFMAQELFQNALAGVEKSGFPLGIVSLVWLGEPLLHPAFSEFFDTALAFGERTALLDAVVLNTNASLLTQCLSAALLDSFVARAKRCRATVTFSLDAASQATYNALKPGADWEKTVDNVREFLRSYAARREAFRMPFVALLQMIVLSENSEEAPAFRDLFGGMLRDAGIPFNVGYGAFGECPGDAPARIVYKRAATENQAEMNRLHRRTVERLGLAAPGEAPLFDLCQRSLENVGEAVPRRHPCAAVFETAVVDWDGRVTPCCADSELELCVGTLAHATLAELYDGPEWRALRQAHLTGDLKRYPRCESCSSCVRPTIAAERLAEYEKELGI